jgi:hypothetical protein
MSHLEPRERQCLAHIAERAGEDIDPCDDGIVRRLLSLGLIEEAVDVRIQLPMARRWLRLTVAGHAALWDGA